MIEWYANGALLQTLVALLTFVIINISRFESHFCALQLDHCLLWAYFYGRCLLFVFGILTAQEFCYLKHEFC